MFPALVPSGMRFQSTPPSRGATTVHSPSWVIVSISIHAPLTGGDELINSFTAFIVISIHAPLTGGDSKNRQII